MRAQFSFFAALLTLAGCVSGTRTVVVREYPASTAPTADPRPVPSPLPVPRRAEQLEIALGAPSSGRLPVQTSRAAYVAIFEIVPKQGVTLVHPSTPKQGRMVMSGLSWLPVWWTPSAQSTHRRASNAPPQSVAPTRYIYALASDVPLRIPERAYEPGYLEQVLGPASYRAASPQAAVRALSRRFAPQVSDEQWAEDLFALAAADEHAPPRMARIYCNGRVHEVPEDVASRAWCPGRAAPVTPAGSGPSRDKPAVMPRPTRPDSVLDHRGRRMGPSSTPPGRTANGPDDEGERGRSGKPARPTHPVTPEKGDNESDKARKEKADKERAEKERAEKAEKERAEKERAEKADKERAEKAEKERADKERAEKAEKERVEKAEKDRAEKERAEKERAEKAENERAEKAEKERVEKGEKDRAEKERAEKERADKAEQEKKKTSRSRTASSSADTSAISAADKGKPRRATTTP